MSIIELQRLVPSFSPPLPLATTATSHNLHSVSLLFLDISNTHHRRELPCSPPPARQWPWACAVREFQCPQQRHAATKTILYSQAYRRPRSLHSRRTRCPHPQLVNKVGNHGETRSRQGQPRHPATHEEGHAHKRPSSQPGGQAGCHAIRLVRTVIFRHNPSQLLTAHLQDHS